MGLSLTNQRLIEIFNLAHENFYSSLENNTHKSIHWKMYDERDYSLQKLINFREKEGLSVGLDDNSQLNLTAELYKKHVDLLTEDYILNNMNKRNIGNSPWNIFHKGKYIDPNRLIHLRWFRYLNHDLKGRQMPKNFCEIGGGFGSFADIIIKNLNIKLISIDLPEANLLTAYYLKENYPDKKFYLYDDYYKYKFLSLEDFDNNDIIILPPNCIIDQRIRIDLFVNARSMMEMNFQAISSYFDFIHRFISRNGYFLNINRYKKKIGEEMIRISEYPYDNDWKVIRSIVSPTQKHIHYFFTQRTNLSEERNIQQKLRELHRN